MSQTAGVVVETLDHLQATESFDSTVKPSGSDKRSNSLGSDQSVTTPNSTSDGTPVRRTSSRHRLQLITSGSFGDPFPCLYPNHDPE